MYSCEYQRRFLREAKSCEVFTSAGRAVDIIDNIGDTESCCRLKLGERVSVIYKPPVLISWRADRRGLAVLSI